MFCSNAQDLDRLGAMIKYSEGVNPGHLILTEQKLVHRRILCITSGWPQAPWALQIPQVKSSWPRSERKQRQPFHRAHSDLWSHHSHTVRGTVDAQHAVPAARGPDELQAQPCPRTAASCLLLGVLRRPQGDLGRAKGSLTQRSGPEARGG